MFDLCNDILAQSYSVKQLPSKKNCILNIDSVQNTVSVLISPSPGSLGLAMNNDVYMDIIRVEFF